MPLWRVVAVARGPRVSVGWGIGIDARLPRQANAEARHSSSERRARGEGCSRAIGVDFAERARNQWVASPVLGARRRLPLRRK
jgi:hypothetical protein